MEVAANRDGAHRSGFGRDDDLRWWPMLGKKYGDGGAMVELMVKMVSCVAFIAVGMWWRQWPSRANATRGGRVDNGAGMPLCEGELATGWHCGDVHTTLVRARAGMGDNGSCGVSNSWRQWRGRMTKAEQR